MAGYGRQILEQTGEPRMVLAELEGALWKVAGITVDWSLFTAVAADTTLDDGTIVKAGDKYARYGQVWGLVGKSEVQTHTFTGGPTAGGGTPTVPASGSLAAETASSAIPFNATAQQFQDALNALTRLGQNGVTVTRSGAGSAGDPYVYAVTFNRNLGNVPQLTWTHDFTGGTSPTVTPATTTAGAGTGLFGPIDTSATDGRQALERGNCYIQNETVLMSELGSDHIPVFEGGLVWAARLLVGEANQPTLANLLTALPMLRLVR